jgi:hypothetical protein
MDPIIGRRGGSRKGPCRVLKELGWPNTVVSKECVGDKGPSLRPGISIWS